MLWHTLDQEILSPPLNYVNQIPCHLLLGNGCCAVCYCTADCMLYGICRMLFGIQSRFAVRFVPSLSMGLFQTSFACCEVWRGGRESSAISPMSRERNRTGTTIFVLVEACFPLPVFHHPIHSTHIYALDQGKSQSSRLKHTKAQSCSIACECKLGQ